MHGGAHDLSSALGHRFLPMGMASPQPRAMGRAPGLIAPKERGTEKSGWVLCLCDPALETGAAERAPVLFCNSIYIICNLLHDANRAGFPRAGMVGEDGCCHTAARLAANPQRGWAMDLPQEPYSSRNLEVGARMGAGGGRNILQSQSEKVKRIGTEYNYLIKW